MIGDVVMWNTGIAIMALAESAGEECDAPATLRGVEGIELLQVASPVSETTCRTAMASIPTAIDVVGHHRCLWKVNRGHVE
ncbi:hypothetical protein HB780_01775 (plasmid) [Rhizobium lusitanum]|uniref:hypothetical protein n=1 Tax=Rhizobium lusitanum TaxID=293958 RepID=UPI001620476D|nr:hypothetical protein [Rhizobium lusitanum]QND44560.1 hypothetical protein HB780_01775 [Rhizobium lusitanum]